MSEKICKSCAYAIFCPSWGEYKCEMKQYRVPSRKDKCEYYKENNKKNDERKCHCLTCVAEGYAEYED